MTNEKITNPETRQMLAIALTTLREVGGDYNTSADQMRTARPDWTEGDVMMYRITAKREFKAALHGARLMAHMMQAQQDARAATKKA